MTKVSVVIPIYNAGEYIKDSLNALLNQTLRDIEIICVNDGSTDNSLEILENFAKRDSRVKVINQENTGAGIARNNGMKIAQGDFIHFIDADDIITVDILEKLYNNAINNEVDFVVFKVARFNEKNTDYNYPIYDLEKVFPEADFNNFSFTHLDIKRNVLNVSYAPWTKFFKREFLEKNQLEFPDISSYNDILFHVKSMLKSSRISFVPEFLYFYRLDNVNSITNDTSKHFNIFSVIKSIEDFLIEENFMDDYKNEFELFKINQISRHMVVPISEEYFKEAKYEFSNMDISDNPLIKNKDLEKYNITLNLSVDELDKFENYLYLVQLKEKNEELENSIKKLNQDYIKQKNIYADLSSSYCWRITKPLRLIKNHSLKESFLNRSNSYRYYKSNYKELKKENKKLKNRMKKLDKDYNEFLLKNSVQYKNEIDNLNMLHKNEIDDLNMQHREEINNSFLEIEKLFTKFSNSESLINNELKYAFVFNDSIKNSVWLTKTDFSLVNSAANYSFMYSLFRILNDAEPKNILELGLGQTTKLTSQYANHFDNVKLTVLESDYDWIEIFSQNLDISDRINIVKLDEETFEYKNTINVRFKNIEKVVGDEKYDLIIIDAPNGFLKGPDGNILLEYSRTNIWQLIPNNLEDDFIIIIDDYERAGEKNTMGHAKELLKENDIELYTYTCKGLKSQHAIFTEKYRFISWI